MVKPEHSTSLSPLAMRLLNRNAHSYSFDGYSVAYHQANNLINASDKSQSVDHLTLTCHHVEVEHKSYHGSILTGHTYSARRTIP